jgi:hypothetical protein
MRPAARRARDVRREHRDARLVRLDDRRADSFAVHRRQDDRIDLLADEVLDLRRLLIGVAIGIDERDRVAVFHGLGLHAGFHVLVELRFEVLNGDADDFRTGRRAARGRAS